MMKLKTLLISAVAVGAMATSAVAQEVTLRLHQMLPQQATIPAKALMQFGSFEDHARWSKEHSSANA